MTESLHRGFIVAVDVEGEVIAALGDIEARTWYRSAAKPFQAIPMLAGGAAEHFKFMERELAIIAASHDGEDFHLEAVNSVLRKSGLREADLLCGAHEPYNQAAAKALQSTGQPPRALHNNCSGKHAGMLAFAKFLGEPTANYLDPQHPIQRRIHIALARFADVPVDDIAIAVDGCSAPVFGLGLKAMARGYAQLLNVGQTDIEPELAAAAACVVRAMTGFPELIAGSHHRLDTDLMRAAGGRIVAKVGAEGLQLLGVAACSRYPKGLGVAIKIEDGDSRRARDPVVIETLRQLGLLDKDQLAQLAHYERSTVFNHRRLEVGEVRTCFQL